MKLRGIGRSASCYLTFVLLPYLFTIVYFSRVYSFQHSNQYISATNSRQSNGLAPGTFHAPSMFNRRKRLTIIRDVPQFRSSKKDSCSIENDLTSSNPKRLLITGSTGLLGVQLLQDAVKRKFSEALPEWESISSETSHLRLKQRHKRPLEIYATARNPSKLQERLQMNPEWKEHVTFHDAFDILNKQDCLDVIRISKPDVIINCVSSKMEHASVYSVNDQTDRSFTETDRSGTINGDTCDAFELCWKGMSNLIEACKQELENFHPLLVLVSAIGAAESEEWVPGVSIDSIRMWLASKSIAEKITKQSGFPYIIIRPCPLSEESNDFSAILSTGPNVFGVVRRDAAANRIMDCLFSEKTVNQTLSVVGKSSVLHANPFVRPYEFYEPLLFEELAL